MSDIPDELVERMVQLVRDLHGDHVQHGAHDIVQNFVSRTAAIVADLPKPIDPDLLEVREILAKCEEGLGNVHMARSYRAGVYADYYPSAIALAALKRGRELAQQEASNA